MRLLRRRNVTAPSTFFSQSVRRCSRAQCANLSQSMLDVGNRMKNPYRWSAPSMETGKAECDQFPYALPEACFGQDVVDGDGRVGPTFVGLVDPLHTIPLHSTPFRPTPLHSNPLHSTPLHSTPFHPTPLLHSTPLHSNLLHSTPFHALELPLEFLLYKPGHTCHLYK